MPENKSAREAAAWALGRWRKGGARLEDIVNEAHKRYPLELRDRSLMMELVYGVVRNFTNLDFILSRYIKETKSGVPPETRDILRVAAYQIVYLDRIPARAAVNEAVEMAKRRQGKGGAGFVNGVLRSLLREPGRVKYPEDPAVALPIKYSYPQWLVKRWIDRLGAAEAEELLRAGNAVPPLTLRVNTQKTDRASLLALLMDRGIRCSPSEYAPDGIRVEGGASVPALPGYAEGLFAVQDEAAQLVSLLVAPKPGEPSPPAPLPEGEGARWTILDACAAPGGKTAHLAGLSGGAARVFPMDISLDKLRLLEENILRLGLNIKAVQGDALHPPFKAVFDAILLDAPCSATGVIRRRPEIKYNRGEEDIARLSGMQRGMLGTLSRLVKPGGALVYSVCSTEPDEGEAVVEGFLMGNRDFSLADAGLYLPEAARRLVTERGYLRTYPHRHGTDGFFGARLCRSG